VEKIFFVVMLVQGRESPCKYHGQIPAALRPDIRYNVWLDDPEIAALSCTELYSRYTQAKQLNALPPSNVEPRDFWVR
jgi:hypothetical protein